MNLLNLSKKKKKASNYRTVYIYRRLFYILVNLQVTKQQAVTIKGNVSTLMTAGIVAAGKFAKMSIHPFKMCRLVYNERQGGCGDL